MEITSDVILKGAPWYQATERLSDIFATRTNYSLFMLSAAIGIMYDQRIAVFEEDDLSQAPRYSARNVILTHDDGKLDIYFQSAILSTATVDLSEEERLKLAFGESKEFNKIDFLTQFANFGVTKLVSLIGSTPLETIVNI